MRTPINFVPFVAGAIEDGFALPRGELLEGLGHRNLEMLKHLSVKQGANGAAVRIDSPDGFQSALPDR